MFPPLLRDVAESDHYADDNVPMTTWVCTLRVCLLRENFPASIIGALHVAKVNESYPHVRDFVFECTQHPGDMFLGAISLRVACVLRVACYVLALLEL